MGDSFVVHFKKHHVLASVDEGDKGIGEVDEQGKEGCEDEPWPCEVPESVEEVAAIGDTEDECECVDAEEDPSEDLIDDEEDGGVGPHVEFVDPSVLAVGAQLHALLELVIVGCGAGRGLLLGGGHSRRGGVGCDGRSAVGTEAGVVGELRATIRTIFHTAGCVG